MHQNDLCTNQQRTRRVTTTEKKREVRGGGGEKQNTTTIMHSSGDVGTKIYIATDTHEKMGEAEGGAAGMRGASLLVNPGIRLTLAESNIYFFY